VLSLSIVGDREVLKYLRDLPDNAEAIVRELVRQMTAVLLADARDPANYAHAAAPLPAPGPLRIVTGDFVRRIQMRVRLSGRVYEGEVFSDHPAAGVHEYGGGNNIPARPWLGPAYARREMELAKIWDDGIDDLANSYVTKQLERSLAALAG
jgi:hypothetical protein